MSCVIFFCRNEVLDKKTLLDVYGLSLVLIEMKMRFDANFRFLLLYEGLSKRHFLPL